MNRFRQLLSRRRLDRDLAEEIQEHLQEKVDDLVAGGMPREEALPAARREFGNVTLMEERGRAVWRWTAVEDFFSDLRFAFRQLRRAPAFALRNPLLLAIACAVVTLTAAVAAYLPARRAASIDPMEALRSE